MKLRRAVGSKDTPAAHPYLEFVYTPLFEATALGALEEEQRREIEAILVERPEVGPVIPGTGGVRKMRFRGEGRGKRGGLPVLYYYDKPGETIYLVLVYPKNVKDTLTAAERNELRKYLEAL